MFGSVGKSVSGGLTLALQSLVDEAVEQRPAVVAECGAGVGVQPEAVLGPQRLGGLARAGGGLRG